MRFLRFFPKDAGADRQFVDKVRQHKCELKEDKYTI